MGNPIHLIRERVREHGVRVLTSNYMLYEDMHRRVAASLQEFARDLEIAAMTSCS